MICTLELVDTPGPGHFSGTRLMILHVLLRPHKREITDVHPALEGKIHVADGKQGKRDEHGKGKYLNGMKRRIVRAEQGSRKDGYSSSGEEHTPENHGEPEPALDQPGTAMLGERTQLGKSMILGDELGRRSGLDRHQRPPHRLVDFMAAFRYLVPGHGRPVLFDDCLSVVASLAFELQVLLLGQALSQTVHIPQGVCLKIYIEVGGSEGGPHGIEHEAENHRVGRSQNAELPSNQGIVRTAFFPGPDPVQPRQKEQRAARRENEDENVLQKAQHMFANFR